MVRDVTAEHLFEENHRLGLERVVELAHRHLRLDVVYLAELCGGKKVIRALSGDAESFGLAGGGESPLEPIYSQLLVTGEITGVIPDTSAAPRVAQLPVTSSARIGAFIGVPLHLPDGSLYGTLCGMNHEPDPTLSRRDAHFMHLLAELIASELAEERRQQLLRAEFELLIEAKRLEIAYQPIVDLRTGTVIGLEALSRFAPPFANPERTFADAHTVGVGLELERLAVSEAWEIIPRLRDDQFLAFNVGPEALVVLAKRAQGRHDLPLRRIVVEITEQAAVESYEVLRDVLGPLRAQGLRLAVDDAGAGYASLHHIVELRPDFVKVDRSLVHGLADDHARSVAMSAFVLLALDLGATVVAEGVERPRDLGALRELGVQAAQGYLLGRPTDRESDLLRWTAPPGPGRAEGSFVASAALGEAQKR